MEQPRWELTWQTVKRMVDAPEPEEASEQQAEETWQTVWASKLLTSAEEDMHSTVHG
jgi:hypothetical protein